MMLMSATFSSLVHAMIPGSALRTYYSIRAPSPAPARRARPRGVGCVWSVESAAGGTPHARTRRGDVATPTRPAVLPQGGGGYHVRLRRTLRPSTSLLMVRLILVRHGESMANRRDMELKTLTTEGGLTREEATKVAPSMAHVEANGDQPLTENGEQQAECWGEFWAPILEGKARAGALHVFCSPMQRNLQTVAPFMRRLHEKGIQLTVEVRPDNCEVPGNIHMNDDAVYANIGSLVNKDPTAAAQLLEQHSWTPAGLSANEIVTLFPWARPQFAGDNCFPVDRAEGWCRGPEWHWDSITEGEVCTKTSTKRFARVADWVGHLRDTLPSDDVCICITHGLSLPPSLSFSRSRSRSFPFPPFPSGSQSLWLSGSLSLCCTSGGMQDRLVNELLHRQYGHGPELTGQILSLHPNSNTSTSCLWINPSGASTVNWRESSAKQATGPAFQIEFYHRMDHLAAGSHSVQQHSIVAQSCNKSCM